VRVEEYLIDLSPESRRLRFLSPSVDVGRVAATAVDVTPHEHVTLLALSGGDDGVVVAGAQYFRIEGIARAEMSVSVADRFQGRGLGSILIGRLAEVARDQGIDAFVADVLPENHRMIAVFRESGFAPQIRALPGAIEVTIPTTLTEDAARHFEEREIQAAANAVRSFLSPETVVVAGASRDPISIGGRLFRNLLDSDFRGVVYPVNPKAGASTGSRRSGRCSTSPMKAPATTPRTSVVKGAALIFATPLVSISRAISDGVKPSTPAIGCAEPS
jgi:GNAT superfamily N-acetyltransferase